MKSLSLSSINVRMQLHVQYVAIFVYNWALLITVQFRGIEINYY